MYKIHYFISSIPIPWGLPPGASVSGSILDLSFPGLPYSDSLGVLFTIILRIPLSCLALDSLCFGPQVGLFLVCFILLRIISSGNFQESHRDNFKIHLFGMFEYFLFIFILNYWFAWLLILIFPQTFKGFVRLSSKMECSFQKSVAILPLVRFVCG